MKNKIILIGNGIFLYCNNIAYASPKGLDKIDTAGITILGLVRRVGYWACIVLGVIDIIKSIMEGDTKEVWKIIMKYSMAFAALYMFPWILDLIKDIFA